MDWLGACTAMPRRRCRKVVVFFLNTTRNLQARGFMYPPTGADLEGSPIVEPPLSELWSPPKAPR